MEKRSVLIAFIILILLALGGAGAGIYFYVQYRAVAAKAADPQAEAKEILTKVGKLIELPTDEEPTVATVNDADKIREQPFFAKAQNGHRVILYQNARLAILFDEAANKIINVGTINVNTPESTPSAIGEDSSAVESNSIDSLPGSLEPTPVL